MQPSRGDVLLVTRGQNPVSLPVGTRLQAVRRYEGWNLLAGCVADKVVMAVARVLDGPRRGELVHLESESEFWDAATWLVGAGE